MSNDRFSSSFSAPSQQVLRSIIQEGDANLLVNVAEDIGKGLARQLTTSQIRNVFGTVRQIEMSWSPQADEEEQKEASRQLLLLKPKLAYQARRERGKGMEQLAQVLVPAIDLVGTERKNFLRFVEFFEAILAYHTAHGAF